MNQHNGSQLPPPIATAQNLGHFLHRIVDLIELQFQLLTIDVRASVTSLMLPATLIMGGLAIALGGICVLLLAVAAAFHEGMGFSVSISLLLAGTIGLLLAGCSAGVGVRWLRNVGEPFDRSKKEFEDNLKWVKASLTHGSSVTHSAAAVCEDHERPGVCARRSQ